MFSYVFDYNTVEWVRPIPTHGDGGNHILQMPRTPVRDLMEFDDDGNLIEGSPRNKLPEKYIYAFQQNQKLNTCCRHVENHHVSGWYSCEDNRRRGVVDVHIFYCTECHPIDYKTDRETGEFVLDDDGNKIEHETRPNQEKWHRMFLIEPFSTHTKLT